MININNKSWNKLRFSDIEKLLSGTDGENFFFEFKSDDETPSKLVKEISAFANTYGGYILLGVNDDLTIGGCTKWTEQRIHTTVHDTITPIPNFDVKKFKHSGQVIYVIKIEEGTMPPYITNKGQIFERVSSGSFPVKESSKLVQLYQKREDQIIQLRNKIEPPSIDLSCNFPNNVFGYLDLGFSVVCSDLTELQKSFYEMNFEPIAKYIRSMSPSFSISQVGYSYLFSFGDVLVKDSNGKNLPMVAGLHNFMEIMEDGSVKCRVVLSGTLNEMNVDISIIGYYICHVFKNVYAMIFGKKFSKIFVHAHKYEKLTVLKQFIPFYNVNSKDGYFFSQFLFKHQRKYGNNLIIGSNRIPHNDYFLIDKKLFSDYKIKYNTENLIAVLFESGYNNLGYIDSLNEIKDTDK